MFIMGRRVNRQGVKEKMEWREREDLEITGSVEKRRRRDGNSNEKKGWH